MRVGKLWQKFHFHFWVNIPLNSVHMRVKLFKSAKTHPPSSTLCHLLRGIQYILLSINKNLHTASTKLSIMAHFVLVAALNKSKVNLLNPQPTPVVTRICVSVVLLHTHIMSLSLATKLNNACARLYLN